MDPFANYLFVLTYSLEGIIFQGLKNIVFYELIMGFTILLTSGFGDQKGWR